MTKILRIWKLNSLWFSKLGTHTLLLTRTTPWEVKLWEISENHIFKLGVANGAIRQQWAEKLGPPHTWLMMPEKLIIENRLCLRLRESPPLQQPASSATKMMLRNFLAVRVLGKLFRHSFRPDLNLRVIQWDTYCELLTIVTGAAVPLFVPVRDRVPGNRSNFSYRISFLISQSISSTQHKM